MAKKLILDIEEKVWKEVLKKKIDWGFKNNNQTVVKLIKSGLKSKPSKIKSKKIKLDKK